MSGGVLRTHVQRHLRAVLVASCKEFLSPMDQLPAVRAEDRATRRV